MLRAPYVPGAVVTWVLADRAAVNVGVRSLGNQHLLLLCKHPGEESLGQVVPLVTL